MNFQCFKNSITKSLEAEERCGNSSLFIIIIQTEDFGGTDHSILKIIEGEDADVAWQVDLGPTEKMKTSPAIVDIDEDELEAHGELRDYADAIKKRIEKNKLIDCGEVVV